MFAGSALAAACAAAGAKAHAIIGASTSADARKRIRINPPVGMSPPDGPIRIHLSLTTHGLPGATHEPWRSLHDGLGVIATTFAMAVQRDVVIGDVERDPRGEAADGALERVVLEGLQAPAPVADQVVVVLVLVLRPLRLVARDAVTHLHAREQPERDQLVEHPVDRRAADPAAVTLAQAVLD